MEFKSSTDWVEDRDLTINPSPPDDLDPSVALNVEPEYATAIVRMHNTPRPAAEREGETPSDLVIGAQFNDAVHLTAEEIEQFGEHPDSDKVNPSHASVREAITHLAGTPPTQWTDSDVYAARIVAEYTPALPTEVQRDNSPMSFESDLTRVDVVRLNWGLLPITTDLKSVLSHAG